MSSANDDGDWGPEPPHSPPIAAPTEPQTERSLPAANGSPLQRPAPPSMDADGAGRSSDNHRRESGWRPPKAGLLAGAATLMTAAPASIVAIITLWIFALFPWLRPWEPPVEQRLSISNVEVVERGHALASREEMTVLFVDVESVGYDRQPLRIATLWLDAATGQRVEPTFSVYGDSVHTTRNVHWVQWLNVAYPLLPDDSSGCLIARVIMYQVPDDELSAAAVPDGGPIGPQMVAYADTEPFDPYVFDGDGACAALRPKE